MNEITEQIGGSISVASIEQAHINGLNFTAVELYPATPGGLYPEIEVSPEQDRYALPISEMMTRASDTFRPFYIVARGKTVGFFMLAYNDNISVEDFRRDDFCELRAFRIDHREQGKGYAKAALSQIVNYLNNDERDIKFLSLTVNTLNEPAIALYKKSGFVDTGELYLGGRSGPQHIMVYEKR